MRVLGTPGYSDDPGVASESAGPRLLAWLVANAAGLLFWAALGGGALARVVRYVDNRSLWLDESFVALNLINRSPRELLEALDYAQSAPPAFLLVQKGAIDLLGDSEMALRLLPLLSSLVALATFAWLSRQIFTPWVATVAMVIFATNEYLIYQASELKPYSSDVAVAVTLVALYVWFERGPATARRALPVTVAGAVAPLLSFPSVLVLAGVGGGVLLRIWRDGTRRALALVAALIAIWVGVFGVVLVVTSNTVQQIAAQVFPGETSVGRNVANVADLAWSVFVDPGNFTNGTNGLAAILAVLGFVALTRANNPSRLVVLTLPPALALGAALLGKYPIGGRYSLFLVPFLIILVALGLDALVRDARRPLLLGGVLIVVLLAPPTVEATARTLSPPRGEDVRPLLEQIADHWEPGDTLYVFRNSQFALRYYTECRNCRPGGRNWPWPSRLVPARPRDGEFSEALASVLPTVVIGTLRAGVDRAAADLSQLRGDGRLWMLFSHVPTWEPLNQETLMRRALDRRARVDGEWRSGDADLVLYGRDPR